MSNPDVDKILNERKKTAAFVFRAGQEKQKAHVSWYRGDHCNFNPTKETMLRADGVETYVLKGWMPEAPFVSKQTAITAFGSCFAAHISDFLANSGYNILSKGNANAYIIRCGEGMVNTYALLQQFEWAFEGKQFSQNLWHGYDAEEYNYDEAIRRSTLDIFQRTDLFIITIGLSEVWHDKQTDDVFWRAIPLDKFDSRRHGFRVTTHAENRANIDRIRTLIRKHRPDAHVLFTLSPIPLVATFRPQGCLSANSVSKAILRSALDEVMSDHAADPALHYFPSYEIVTSVFDDPFVDDRRHVKPEILDFVMASFERFFCIGSDDVKIAQYHARLTAAFQSTGQIRPLA